MTILAGLALAACGSDVETPPVPSASPPFTSGKRLRAHVDAVGGAAIFRHWVDTGEGGLSCELLATADGKLRCLPLLRDESSAYLTPGDVVYGDAACTEPLRVARAGKQPQALVTVPLEASGSCDLPTHVVRELGAPASPTVTFVKEAGACVESGTPTSEYAYFALGAEVASDRFVAAHEELEPRTEALAARLLVADDGASQIIGAHDRTRDVSCWLAPFGEIDGPCLPLTLAYLSGGYFSDAACSQKIAYAPEGLTGSDICQPATVIVDYATPACGAAGGLTLYSAGAEVSPSTVYLQGAACMAFQPGSTVYRFYEPGAAIPPESFPQIVSEHDDASRIAVVYETAGGGPLRAVGFYDNERGAPCAPLLACDGARRCFESTAIASSESGPFADPLCEQRLIGYGVDPACEPPVPRYAMVSPSVGCAADATVGEVREVAGRYEGTLYYFDPSTGTCTAGSASTPTDRYFLLGATVPLDTYARVEERTE